MLNSNELPKILSEPLGAFENNFLETFNFQFKLPNWQFETDTRKLVPGAWFVAFEGQNFDAHNFLPVALEAGAAGLIVSDPSLAALQKVPTILVQDTIKAYQQIARAQRRALKPITIALTGSNGKTTTKEMLSKVLSTKYKTYATQANENNEIGVPKTILEAPINSEALVLECGMRGLGQIAELVEVAEPEYSLITNIGTAHIGLLGSRENIARAKAELFCAEPSPRVAYHPAEPLLEPWIKLKQNTVIFKQFGSPHPVGLQGNCFQFEYGGSSFRLATPNLALLSNACAVIELARDLGLSDAEIQKGFAEFSPGAGRGKLYTLPSGTTVIDETYNASPDSVLALTGSLQWLGKHKKKILVLGEIAEMGDFAGDLLKSLATQIAGSVDLVILIGESNRALHENLPPHSSVWFASLEEVFAYFKTERSSLLQENCLLGLKASRVNKLERLLSWLTEELSGS